LLAQRLRSQAITKFIRLEFPPKKAADYSPACRNASGIHAKNNQPVPAKGEVGASENGKMSPPSGDFILPQAERLAKRVQIVSGSRKSLREQ